MEYIEGMSVRYAGGDPDELLRLARVLSETATDLQRLQVRLEWAAGGAQLPAETAVITARVRVWAATQSEDVRRRARELDDGRWLHFDGPQFPPFAGPRSQRGGKRVGLTDPEAQLQRARATLADPNATKAAKKAANSIVQTERKNTGDKRNRPLRDAKPKPKSRTSRTEAELRKAAQRAAKEAERAAEEAARQAADEAARKGAEDAVKRATRQEAARAMLAEGNDGMAEGVVAAAGVAAVGVWWAGKLLSPACGPAVLVCAAVL